MDNCLFINGNKERTMKVISVTQMQKLDAETIDKYCSVEDLMLEAGKAVYREVSDFISSKPIKSVFVFCGKGNNGGDGYVIANCFLEDGFEVTIVSTSPFSELSGVVRHFALKVKNRVRFTHTLNEITPSKNSLIIDGLLGTGFSGEVRSDLQSYITFINATPSTVVSVDIPSGLNGDSGESKPLSVCADMTVTIGAPKQGLFLNDGLEQCGQLRLAVIGIPKFLIEKVPSTLRAVFSNNLPFLSQHRRRNSHKKTFGSVFVLAGSKPYSGAAQLACLAAMRSGCGYVSLVHPEAMDIQQLPLSLIRYPQHGDFLTSELGELREKVKGSTTALFGPGLGRFSAEVLSEILEVANSLVLDADGLWLLGEVKSFSKFAVPTVLTPHPGEMRGLMTRFLPTLLELPRKEQAVALAKYLNCYVVLKGKFSLIVTPLGKCSINTSGNEALATAGTGDVLAGIISAFLAEALTENQSLLDAIEAAVFIHGRCVEEIDFNARCFIADDLLELLMKVL